MQLKLKLILLTFSLIPAFAAMSQCALHVEITNLKSDKGVIMLELRNNTDSLISNFSLPITDLKSKLDITNLQTGNYLINYYHDANQNHKMDKNIVGMPTEGYGFSNNPDAKFGPPSYEKLLFPVTGETKVELVTYNW